MDDTHYNTPKGDGTIGYTPAGQKLDAYLSINKPPYRSKLESFITNFTNRARRIRTLLDSEEDQYNKFFILKLTRQHYLKEAKERFETQLEDLPYSLLNNYIKTLTKMNFTPNTKTQIDLMNRGQQQRFL